MLNNVKFQSHLHHMGNMFEGCYTADWDGKSLCIVVNISPKKLQMNFYQFQQMRARLSTSRLLN